MSMQGVSGVWGVIIEKTNTSGMMGNVIFTQVLFVLVENARRMRRYHTRERRTPPSQCSSVSSIS